MKRTEAIRKLQAVRTELTTLLPRLTPNYRMNIDACRNELDAVIDALSGTVRGGVRQSLEDDHG